MKAKRITKAAIGLLSLTLLTASCNDWLDIQSDNILLEDQLFEQCTGVEMAVNGVYDELGSEDLYGRNLSWGFASVLAQDYNRSSLPDDGLRYVASYTWANSSTQGYTEAIWAKAYYVIANINDILQNVEGKDSTFFRSGQIEKDLIMAEMRGVRAMVHFDLMRLFCPVPSSANGETPAIPYVESYPIRQPKRLTLKEVKEKIIADMDYARATLGDLDTLKFSSWTNRWDNRFPYSNHPISMNNDFLNRRGVRLNYWGAAAILARMYMYCGEKEKAYNLAKSLVHFIGTNSWADKFYWENQYSIGYNTSETRCYNNQKRITELCFGLWNQDNLTNFENATFQDGIYTMGNMDNLFEGETDDYRYSGLYDTNSKRYTTWTRPSTTSSNPSYLSAARNKVEYQSPLIPMVRFIEMYHIMIEYLIDNNRLDEAKSMFSDIRLKRGVKNAYLPSTAEALKEKLVNEMVREGLTEGQTFFMYKRLNHDILYGDRTIPMTAQDFIAEYPNNEINY